MIKIPTINTNKEKFYLQYLTILNPVLFKLAAKELELFALFIAQYNEYGDMPTDLKDELLFATTTRKTIRSKFLDKNGNSITEAYFNNLFMVLKTKKLIIDAGNGHYKINPKFILDPKVDTSLTFNWNIL